MPTRPFDQGWFSPFHDPLEVLGVVGSKVVEAALRASGSSQVNHHDRVAARCEVAGEAERSALGVPRFGKDAPPLSIGERAVIGTRLHDDGEGALSVGANDLDVELDPVVHGHPDLLAHELVVGRLRQTLDLGVIGRA